jgi:predicted nucleic acid-binding protein
MVTREVVIDTSVAFKWFVAYGETGLTEAARLLRSQRTGEVTLIAPSIIVVELANTLRYLTPDPEDALGFIDDFDCAGVQLFDTTLDLVRNATVRASESGIGVYDALFLALAEQRNCMLASADRKAFGNIKTSIDVLIV